MNVMHSGPSLTGIVDVVADTVTFGETLNTLTPTELSYVQGATSSLQTQIDSLVLGSLGGTDLSVHSVAASASLSAGTTLSVTGAASVGSLTVGGVNPMTSKQDALTTASNVYVNEIRLTQANGMTGAVSSVGNVAAQLQDVWTTLGTQGSGLSTAQSDVTTLQGDVTALEGDVATLQTDVTTLQTTKVETLAIGTVTDVSYGTAGSVTIDNTDPLHPLLNFQLRQGNPGATGATGPQGDTGPAGSDADTTALAVIVAANSAAIAAGAATAVALQSQISANYASLGVLSGEVATVEGQVTTLEAKTVNFASAVPGVSTTINNTVKIRDVTGLSDQVVLSSTGQSDFYNGIHSQGAMTVDGNFNASDVVISGTCSVGGDLTCNDVGVTGALHCETTVEVTGTLTAHGDVVVDGGLGVQDLDVYGPTHLGALTTSGDCTLGTSSLSSHTIGGVSLTITCPFVSIPFLSVPSYSSFPSGYSLSY